MWLWLGHRLEDFSQRLVRCVAVNAFEPCLPSLLLFLCPPQSVSDHLLCVVKVVLALRVGKTSDCASPAGTASCIGGRSPRVQSLRSSLVPWCNLTRMVSRYTGKVKLFKYLRAVVYSCLTRKMTLLGPTTAIKPAQEKINLVLRHVAIKKKGGRSTTMASSTSTDQLFGCVMQPWSLLAEFR